MASTSIYCSLPAVWHLQWDAPLSLPFRSPAVPGAAAAPRARFVSRCGRKFGPVSAAATPVVQQEPASGVTFIRQHLRELAPYTPIEPFEILSRRLGRLPKDIIKLDANENPYGPPPEVMEALGKMEFPNIYPDPESRRLRAALSEDSGLGAEHILVGCGADELIDLIMRCTLDPGDTILDFPPTFTMYAFDAAVNGANVVKVPRLEDFSLNMPKILEAARRHNPKLIFVTSPNNPDGSLITEQHLLELLKLPALVVLDEAYIEFANEPSRMPWVKKFDNLIVLRTFSKRAGLAGIRVGYGAFPLSIIEFLWRAKQPYNVSVAAETAACAALQNPTYLEEVKLALVSEREKMYTRLKDIPFLTPYPSNSNFILCSVLTSSNSNSDSDSSTSKSAKQLKADLAKEGVMVRHYDNNELRNYIRVSVGRPEHTDALFAAFAKVT